jgi:hypothetical protein
MRVWQALGWPAQQRSAFRAALREVPASRLPAVRRWRATRCVPTPLRRVRASVNQRVAEASCRSLAKWTPLLNVPFALADCATNSGPFRCPAYTDCHRLLRSDPLSSSLAPDAWPDIHRRTPPTWILRWAFDSKSGSRSSAFGPSEALLTERPFLSPWTMSASRPIVISYSSVVLRCQSMMPCGIARGE